MKEKMSKNEFFNEIIRHFQDDVKSAKNDTFPSYTEKEAKELLETARERDLKELSRIWEYLVKRDGEFFWTVEPNEIDRTSIKIV